MTTANQIADGRYVLAPEGSAWVGLDIRAGRIVAMCEEAVHATFAAAADDRADLAPEADMDEVSAAEAAAIVALWDDRCSPECVAVYRR